MTERNLSIRLSVRDSEVVRRALEGLGNDGQRALQRISRAADETGPGLQALSEIGGGVRGVMEDFAGRAGMAGSALAGLGPAGLAAAAAIGATVSALTMGMRDFSLAEQASLRLEAVIKTTGHSAGVTAGEIEALADRLEASTMATAEQVKEAAAGLATFRTVAGDVFTDAVRLAQDMAAVFGGDVRSAAVQLGKALEDPEQGLTALRRAGVTFTDSQREMIVAMFEAGDTAEAQRHILAALEQQVGGAGAAEAQGLAGATKKAADAWGNLMEEFAETSGAVDIAMSSLSGLQAWANEMLGESLGKTASIVAEKSRELAEIEQRLAGGFHPAGQTLRARAEQLRREIDLLVAEDRAKVDRLHAGKDEARAGQAEAERLRNAEAVAGRIKALQEDVVKGETDAAAKILAERQRLTRDIAAEEQRRGKAGVSDADVDQAIELLKRRAQQRIEVIDKPAREASERASKQMVEDARRFDQVMADLKMQVLKATDARAAFIEQAVSRLPESLRGRAEIVETVRQEAAATYDAVEANKALLKIEENLANSRRQMEEEGARLAESVRTAEERHADTIERVNELYEAGVISAEVRARAVEKAHEDLARSGDDAFKDLQRAVEGWGRSSARSIAEAMTSGKASVADFATFATDILTDVLEMFIYQNITKDAVSGLGGMMGGLGGIFSGLFDFGGGAGAAAPASLLPSSAPVFGGLYHAGGLVGTGPRVPVDPSWYDTAPRYHGGGGPRLPRLGPGEVPAVLLDTEEVLTQDDPRHIRNLARMPFAQAAAPAVSVPVTLNVTTPPGTKASASSRRDSGGGLTLDVLVEQVEGVMAGNIARGAGIAPQLEHTYNLARGGY